MCIEPGVCALRGQGLPPRLVKLKASIFFCVTCGKDTKNLWVDLKLRKIYDRINYE